jgi:2,5-diamino-6-(ribosylamino)-4(3H)-pyrimidinone 5'-phosphate reductase
MPSDRPHVTLTWAQSLDSKIAGPGGKRVMISGDESMLMTHWYVKMNPRMLWTLMVGCEVCTMQF